MLHCYDLNIGDFPKFGWGSLSVCQFTSISSGFQISVNDPCHSKDDYQFFSLQFRWKAWDANGCVPPEL